MRLTSWLHVKLFVMFVVAAGCVLTAQESSAQQIAVALPSLPQVPSQPHPFKPVTSLGVQQLPQVAPLTSRQKFALFGDFTLDPTTYIVTGLIAGVEQAGNTYVDFGQGARGYGKRYGTASADFFTADFFGETLFPVLFKQDPRYFYKGEGTIRARTLYAISNSVIGRGDNHRKQVNYSRLLGDLSSGAISNLYYPASSRGGAALTFYNFGFGIAAQAATNLVQEFLLHKNSGSK